MLEKIKEHVHKYRTVYIAGTTGVVCAGITYFIMRSVASRPISVSIVADTAQGSNVAVLGERAVMNNVSLISANRQGSPSWVVRCLETDDIFTSQKKAALSMGIPQDELSQHLNGLRDTVRGRTFERICMAA